ncbi:MAG: hypothetical protein ACJ8FA_03010 [Xanthobacteraceae bacterium]
MLDKLIAAKFQIDFRSHGKAILEIDFPDVAEVIEDVLLGSTIPIEEIIRSGGGETKGTQRLRNALRAGSGRDGRSRRTAARVTWGAISLSSSSHFPLMEYS